jgi:hypothetical protein
VRVVSVVLGAQNMPVPLDPRSSLSAPQADVVLNGFGPAVVHVAGQFIQPGASVYVRVTNVYGTAVVYTGTLVGTFATTTAAVNVTIPQGVSAVQARAEL